MNRIAGFIRRIPDQPPDTDDMECLNRNPIFPRHEPEGMLSPFTVTPFPFRKSREATQGIEPVS
jgi:hypothetical protein